MSDSTTSVAAPVQAPAPQAPTQPVLQPITVAPPSTAPTEAEITRLRQLAAEADQLRPYREQAAKHGISDPSQFDSAFRPITAARQRGLDLDQLVGSFSTPQPQRPQPSQPSGPIGEADVARIVSRQFEIHNHQTGLMEQERLATGLVNEIAGSGSEIDREFARSIVVTALANARKSYPSSHALANDDLAPISGTDFNAVATQVKEKWRQFRGGQLAAIGTAPVLNQTAGAPSQAGPATVTGTHIPILFSKQPREVQEAAAERHFQAMRAGPISGI